MYYLQRTLSVCDSFIVYGVYAALILNLTLTAPLSVCDAFVFEGVYSALNVCTTYNDLVWMRLLLPTPPLSVCDSFIL